MRKEREEEEEEVESHQLLALPRYIYDEVTKSRWDCFVVVV